MAAETEVPIASEGEVLIERDGMLQTSQSFELGSKTDPGVLANSLRF
jgi:hypothetical protein